MKKINIFLLLSILVIFLFFSYTLMTTNANILGNAIKPITKSLILSCRDSDNGNNPSIKGTVTLVRKVKSILSEKQEVILLNDTCNGNILIEYFCMGNNPASATIPCGSCKKGSCITSTLQTDLNLYVSKSGSDSNKGTNNSPLKTIQRAISVANEGTTIKIYSGRYNEYLIINKSLNLEGIEKDKVSIGKYSPDISPIVRIKNSQNVNIKNINISGAEISPFQNSPQGIYVENVSNLTLEGINLFSFRNVYITLYKSNFLLKNIKLYESEVNNIINADLGISIADSEGIIDNLENKGNNIDHVIDRGVTFISLNNIALVDTKSLIIKNSIFRGRNFNWGDGIRIYGSGNNIKIENNTFIGYSGITLLAGLNFPSNVSNYRYLLPNAINLANTNSQIDNNKIIGYPTGILIEGMYNNISGKNNLIYNNFIGIRVSNYDLNFNLDFGGGSFQSIGLNNFTNNLLYNIYYQNTYANNYQSNQIFYLKYNNWNTNDIAIINSKIWDKRDDPNLAEVQYLPSV